MKDKLVAVTGVQVDLAGTTHGFVRLYGAKTGELQWHDSWPVWAVFGLSLAMNDQQVFVASTVLDATGSPQIRVRSYTAKSGMLAWQDQSLAPAGFTEPRGGPITVQGGRVFVAGRIHEPPVNLPYSPESCLVRSYDKETGQLLWQSTRRFFAAASNCVPHDIRADGGVVAIVGRGTHDIFFVQAFDAGSGGLLWHDNNDGSPLQDALVAVDAVRRQVVVTGWRYTVGDDGTPKEVFMVRSYEIDTGALRWNADFLGAVTKTWHGSDIAIAGDRAFAVAYDFAGRWLVRAFNLGDGHVLWEDLFQSGAGGDSYWMEVFLAVDGPRVFVVGSGANANGDENLVLRAYDA